MWRNNNLEKDTKVKSKKVIVMPTFLLVIYQNHQFLFEPFVIIFSMQCSNFIINIDDLKNFLSQYAVKDSLVINWTYGKWVRLNFLVH